MDPEAAESMRQFFRDHGCILKDSVWIIPGSVFSVESLDPETSIRGIGKKEEFTNKLDQLLREYGYDKANNYIPEKRLVHKIGRLNYQKSQKC